MSEENKTLNKGLDALLGQSNTNQRSVKEIEKLNILTSKFASYEKSYQKT